MSGTGAVSASAGQEQQVPARSNENRAGEHAAVGVQDCNLEQRDTLQLLQPQQQRQTIHQKHHVPRSGAGDDTIPAKSAKLVSPLASSSDVKVATQEQQSLTPPPPPPPQQQQQQQQDPQQQRNKADKGSHPKAVGQKRKSPGEGVSSSKLETSKPDAVADPPKRARLRRSTRSPRNPRNPFAFKSLFHSAGASGEVRRAGGKTLRRLHGSTGVWLVENFLTDAEVDRLDLVVTPNAPTFKSSFTDDNVGDRRYSSERTSKFIWLSKGHNELVRRIEQRAAELVGLSSTNVEPLQIVAYRDGQRFNEHHDMGVMMDDGSVEAGSPRRLVTFFVYLNTLPEGQGHTEMTRLGVSVRPQRGSALLFCNVDANGEPEPLAAHRACPVEAPYVKYGMNIWITDSNLQFLAGQAKRKIRAPRNPEAILAGRGVLHRLEREAAARREAVPKPGSSGPAAALQI